MDTVQIILWVVGVGFTFNFGLMLVMWNALNKRIDGLETSLSARIDSGDKNLSARIDSVEKTLSARIDSVERTLGAKIDKLDEKLTDVDRRLCRLEGAFSSKECCMIKDDRQIRKAE